MSTTRSAPAYNGPDYARGNQAYKTRARKIIANNDTSEPSCSICIDKQQACYRHPEYRKCAFCTAREITQPFCHLPETLDPPRTHQFRRNTKSTATAKNKTDTTDQMANPIENMNGSMPGGENENVVRELEAIITAQETHIQELSQSYDQLNERVARLENSAANSATNMRSFEQPSMTRSDNTRNPRRLHPTMMQTLLMNSSHNPLSLDPAGMQQQDQPMNPSQPSNYRPPYTEPGEEQPDGTLPQHTISHTAGFTPMNCSCALPHTLQNGDQNGGEQIPR